MKIRHIHIVFISGRNYENCTGTGIDEIILKIKKDKVIIMELWKKLFIYVRIFYKKNIEMIMYRKERK